MDIDGLLDSEGDWEVRSSVYRDGKLVGHVDVMSAGTFDNLSHTVSCAFEERDVVRRIRKPRK
ncbi:hypothetical protein JOF57_001889 [Mycolicibacterium lutetiense]|jgi:hypothetical protein|uniref:Uncharacterized protein n=1 Tax=Mycolicibacterium lutetiense TaxID=1641992 RepID=A0ABS4ZRZ6_9MYCO|nr:hypothetical protein [Mycolicibacterium lutetiense]